jgi:hypothetical protein
MIADMGRFDAIGARRGDLWVHGQNLACEFRPFHYVGGNRFA